MLVDACALSLLVLASMVAERDGEAHFGRGMCEKCFRHQLNLEGMADGDDPPAYKAALLKAERAELERVRKCHKVACSFRQAFFIIVDRFPL